MSEEDAIKQYGEDNIEVFIRCIRPKFRRINLVDKWGINYAQVVISILHFPQTLLWQLQIPLFLNSTKSQVYHTKFEPTEQTILQKETNHNFAKMICNMSDNERVLGIHYLGPNAGWLQRARRGEGVSLERAVIVVIEINHFGP